MTAAGLVVVDSADDAPAAVVQGYAADVGWRQLAEAAYAIEAGAWFVASNLDPTLPTERGFAPGNGSLVAAVRHATGVEPVSAGKPEPTLYRLAAARRGARSPLVVGDRLDTDLAGARAAGWPGLHVLTGVSTARDAVLAAPGERPSYLGADLRSLVVPHPAPVLDDGWWRCRGAARQGRRTGAWSSTGAVRKRSTWCGRRAPRPGTPPTAARTWTRRACPTCLRTAAESPRRRVAWDEHDPGGQPWTTRAPPRSRWAIPASPAHARVAPTRTRPRPSIPPSRPPSGRPSRAGTGTSDIEAQVDDLLADVTALPLREQVGVFESVHAVLTDRLSEKDA